MEVAFVWGVVLALILAVLNLGYSLYLWYNAVEDRKRNTWSSQASLRSNEAMAAREVVKAFVMVILAFTGPLFLLGLVVYALVLFGKALNNSLKNNQS